MKFLHVRPQGKSAFSFRLRLFDRYVDAGDTYETEEDAAFATDLAKWYLKTFFFVEKNTEPSLDGELFSALAYRHNVVLSDRLSVLAALSPGVVKYLDNHQAYLEQHRAESAPERTQWQALRESSLFNTSPAIAEWVTKCEHAEQEAKDFAVIDARLFATRLEVARNAAQTAVRSLGIAQRMHDGVTNPRLVERARIIAELLAHIEATETHIRFLVNQFKDEDARIASAISVLEATRPPLI